MRRASHAAVATVMAMAMAVMPAALAAALDEGARSERGRAEPGPTERAPGERARIERGPTERARIERLIHHVARQRGVVFVRNSETFDAPKAAAHLQSKLERAGDRVRTVDDFIDGVASRSWLSGQAYSVRLPDGSEQPASQWLRSELRRLETGVAAEGR